MEHISTVANRLVRLSPEASSREAAENAVIFNIQCFIKDVCGVLKNIRETSLDESDKILRIHALARLTGIHSNELFELL